MFRIHLCIMSWILTAQHYKSYKPVLRIHDILVRIRIRRSVPLTNGSGSFYFVIDLQDTNKKKIFLIFSAYYFLKDIHIIFQI
jgi:hypothetical protein